MKSESIVGGALKYSVSTWANMIIGFLSVIISTRVIKPDVYGLLYLFFSASNVLMYLLSVGMDASLIRFYNEPPKDNTINQVLYKCITITTISFAVFGVVCILFLGVFISNKIFGLSSRLLVGYLFIYAYSLAIFRYLNIAYRMSFRIRKYTIQNILLNSLTRVLMIVAALFTDGFMFITCLMSLGIFAVVILYIFVQRDDIRPVYSDNVVNYSINFQHYGEFFKYAILALPISFVADFNTYLSQQIIYTNLSSSALGIFASSGIFAQILFGVRGGFSTFWSAFVFKNYETERERISSMHSYIVLASIMLVSVLVMFRDVIYLAIGKDFHDSKQFFSLLLTLPIVYFMAESTHQGIYLAKKNEIALMNFSILVATNIGLCVLLIPIFGLMGAAYASAISAVIFYIIDTMMGQKYYNSISSIPKSVVGTILVLLILWYPSFTLNIVSIIVFTLFIDVVGSLVFRKEIQYAYQYALSYVHKLR